MRLRHIAAVVLALSLLGCTPGMKAAMGFPAPDASVGVVMTLAANPAAPASNSCTAPPAGACAGCSASCPSERSAYCSSGLTDWTPVNTSHPPVCRQAARCYCGA